MFKNGSTGIPPNQRSAHVACASCRGSTKCSTPSIPSPSTSPRPSRLRSTRSLVDYHTYLLTSASQGLLSISHSCSRCCRPSLRPRGSICPELGRPMIKIIKNYKRRPKSFYRVAEPIGAAVTFYKNKSPMPQNQNQHLSSKHKGIKLKILSNAGAGGSGICSWKLVGVC